MRMDINTTGALIGAERRVDIDITGLLIGADSRGDVYNRSTYKS